MLLLAVVSSHYKFSLTTPQHGLILPISG